MTLKLTLVIQFHIRKKKPDSSTEKPPISITARIEDKIIFSSVGSAVGSIGTMQGMKRIVQVIYQHEQKAALENTLLMKGFISKEMGIIM